MPTDVEREHGLSLSEWSALPAGDAIVAAVPHREYRDMPRAELLSKLRPGGVFIDVKSVHPGDEIRSQGFSFWRL
jgi:UDP-N-acetyl-D-galactosamine dehydrogenase